MMLREIVLTAISIGGICFGQGEPTQEFNKEFITSGAFYATKTLEQIRNRTQESFQIASSLQLTKGPELIKFLKLALQNTFGENRNYDSSFDFFAKGEKDLLRAIRSALNYCLDPQIFDPDLTCVVQSFFDDAIDYCISNNSIPNVFNKSKSHFDKIVLQIFKQSVAMTFDDFCYTENIDTTTVKFSQTKACISKLAELSALTALKLKNPKTPIGTDLVAGYLADFILLDEIKNDKLQYEIQIQHDEFGRPIMTINVSALPFKDLVSYLEKNLGANAPGKFKMEILYEMVNKKVADTALNIIKSGFLNIDTLMMVQSFPFESLPLSFENLKKIFCGNANSATATREMFQQYMNLLSTELSSMEFSKLDVEITPVD